MGDLTQAASFVFGEMRDQLARTKKLRGEQLMMLESLRDCYYDALEVEWDGDDPPTPTLAQAYAAVVMAIDVDRQAKALERIAVALEDLLEIKEGEAD